MKRLLVLTVLALTAVAGSARPAFAWSNFRFNVGLNLAWQGGGNSYLFGMFRSGPAPAPWAIGPGPGGPAGPAPYYPYYTPYNYPYYSPLAMQNRGPTATARRPMGPVPTPPAMPTPPAPRSASVPTIAPTSAFQPVGYFSSQAPSYWYQR